MDNIKLYKSALCHREARKQRLEAELKRITSEITSLQSSLSSMVEDYVNDRKADITIEHAHFKENHTITTTTLQSNTQTDEDATIYVHCAECNVTMSSLCSRNTNIDNIAKQMFVDLIISRKCTEVEHSV